MYYVYKHVNKINGKIYIGVTLNPKRRWSGNGYQYKQCKLFYNAIQKYGWNNFEHIIIKENLTKEEAFELEQKLIKQYRDISYNIADGGNCGPILFGEQNPNYHKERSRTHCENLSKSLIGHATSNETKQKISENNKMKRKIMCIETSEYFESISIAANKYNTFVENIWRVVSGKRKSWHNLHFVYVQ